MTLLDSRLRMHGFSPRIFSLLRVSTGMAWGLVMSADALAEVVLPLGARTAVCFPPAPPVMGDAIPEGPGPPPAGHFIWSPPEDLASYVNETFYPPLSSRLMARTLNARLSARLQAYTEERNALLWELADQLLALQGVEEEARESELRTFASHQRPRIIALETEAERLRRALIDGGLFQANVNWNDQRRWRLGAIAGGDDSLEKEAQFQVVRAAAYYEEGFTIEQRSLLFELAAELQARARAARPFPVPRTDDPAAIYFSPAMSRFRLPRNATPRLIEFIARFNRLKHALKNELQETISIQDRAGAEDRARAFETLAERQAPRLSELEKLAEEIRGEMARIPPTPPRAGPHVPAFLARELEDYRLERQHYIDALEQSVRAAMDLHHSRLSVRAVNEKERSELARLRAEDRISLRARVARAFQEEHRERYEALRRRDQAIQEQLRIIAAGRSDGETGEPLTAETLLRGHIDAEERFNAFGREEVIYRGYRLAMWMRGLSPEQRRLLFGLAWVSLAQPLPAGEPMPSGSQPTPRS